MDAHGGPTAQHHLHGLHHDLDIAEDGPVLRDGEVVEDRRLEDGEHGDLGVDFIPVPVKAEVCEKWQDETVAEGEDFAGAGVLLGVGRHAGRELPREVPPL